MAFVWSISPDPTLNELILTKGTIFFLRNNNDRYSIWKLQWCIFVYFYICDAFLMAIYVLDVHSLWIHCLVNSSTCCVSSQHPIKFGFLIKSCLLVSHSWSSYCLSQKMSLLVYSYRLSHPWSSSDQVDGAYPFN